MLIQQHHFKPMEPDPSGIKQYLLETNPATPICKSCNSVMKPKGSSRKVDDRRIVYDIENGVPIKIQYWPKKYRCNKCKAVIPDPNAPKLTTAKASEEFATYLAQETLSDSTATVRSVSEKYDLSVGYVSQSITNHLDAIKSTIVSYLPCSKLWIEHTLHHHAPCYVVFGYADSLSKWVLLDAIPQEDALLLDLCQKVSTPREMHCPLDAWLLNTLSSNFKAAKIKVPVSEFLSKLDLVFTESVKDAPDDIYTAACTEKNKLEKGIKRKSGFESFQMMDEWFCALSGETDPILNTTVLPDFYSKTYPFLRHIYADMIDKDKEPDCVGRIRALMRRYNRSRIPLSVTRLHLLYQAEFFRRSVKENKQMIYPGGYRFAGIQKIPQIKEWVNCYTEIPD